jgi:hypothetical protein
MHLKHILAVGAFTASIGQVQAQDMVENPEFISWAKFPKGTSVRLKSISTVDGKASEVIVAVVLLEVGPERVVIESSSTEIRKGKDFKTEPVKREIAKTIALPKGLTKEAFIVGKPPGTTADGTETLKVGEMELKVVWYKFRAEVDGTKIEGKRWVSNQVPGNIVKNEITSTGVFSSTLTLELVEIKKP